MLLLLLLVADGIGHLMPRLHGAGNGVFAPDTDVAPDVTLMRVRLTLVVSVGVAVAATAAAIAAYKLLHCCRARCGPWFRKWYLP